MLGHISIPTKCGVVGCPRSHKEEHLSSVAKPLSVSFRPASDLKRQIKIHSGAIGCRYKALSAPVMERLKNKDVVEEIEDLDLSRSYESAMEALSSLITQKKRGDPSSSDKAKGKYNKLERMQMYLKILELEDEIEGLKIIHVAGTKGKGSTCVFCEAILRECGLKTGLFTSPHLIDVRERFRIDGLNISEEKFLLYFWNCWNQLKEHVNEDLPMPPLFQFLTVLAFKIFVFEKVDVAVIEVGLGGTKDSTNVIKKPVVCGITSLGMDHTEALGDTLGEIAAQKAGIFKPRIPAFTVPQLSEAMDVVQLKADELMVPLELATPLDYKKLEGLTLSLDGDHQYTNAGLAVSLCKCWLQRTGKWNDILKNENYLPEPFVKGLSKAHLSGRAQIVHDSSQYSILSKSSDDYNERLVFYLDGAHSPESMEVCAKWFSSAVKRNNRSPIPFLSFSDADTIEIVQENGFHFEKNNTEVFNKSSKKILLFNCMDIRDPNVLLPHLVNACASSGTYFSKAIFVPSMSSYNKVTSATSVIPSDISKRNFSWQFNLQRIWEKIIHGTETDALLDNSTDIDYTAVLTPSLKFLYEDSSHCNPFNGHYACSTVIPSLPLTIKWLRDCVRQNPTLKLQVLVTGSLHLVGDVLKLLKK